MPDAQVHFPKEDEFDHLNSLILKRHPLLVWAFGSMGGLNLPVQTSTDKDIENATYNGWLHAHFVSLVYAFGADGKHSIYFHNFNLLIDKLLGTIIACSLNAPGSWHDSHIAMPIYEKLIHKTPQGYYLVTNMAFQRGVEPLEGKIVAPLKQRQRLPDDEEERNVLLEYNRQILSY
jgi:hypothetical protein